MKRVERYKVLRVVAVIGLVGAIVLANHAFDAHDKALLAIAVVIAFVGMFFIAHASRQLGNSDIVMRDDWEPTSKVNPATGLPMLSSSIDAAGNPYGFRQHGGHRLGG
jgi:hypothetical protein